MAERVIDLVISKRFSGRMLKKCHTGSLVLANHTFTSYQDVRKYIVSVRKHLEPFGLDFKTAHYLVENYGQQTDAIISHMRDHSSGIADKRLALLSSELWYCMNHELVARLSDFLIRRTGLLYFDTDTARRYAEILADQMQVYLRWTDTRKETEVRLMHKALEETSYLP
jgi:glycerol-3-phosphate dehydrogenase